MAGEEFFHVGAEADKGAFDVVGAAFAVGRALVGLGFGLDVFGVVAGAEADDEQRGEEDDNEVFCFHSITRISPRDLAGQESDGREPS